MKIRLCLMAGIFWTAAIAGVFEALNSPRGKKEQKEQKEEGKGKAEAPENSVCDGL